MLSELAISRLAQACQNVVQSFIERTMLQAVNSGWLPSMYEVTGNAYVGTQVPCMAEASDASDASAMTQYEV